MRSFDLRGTKWTNVGIAEIVDKDQHNVRRCSRMPRKTTAGVRYQAKSNDEQESKTHEGVSGRCNGGMARSNDGKFVSTGGIELNMV